MGICRAIAVAVAVALAWIVLGLLPTDSTTGFENKPHTGFERSAGPTKTVLHPETPGAPRTSGRKKKNKPPNIVVVLTDDLDWTLGGATASTLKKTRRLLGGGDGNASGNGSGNGSGNSNNSNDNGNGNGTTFSNWFVQTPVCCASRAELLTGKMYHNLRVKEGAKHQGCMHVDVEDDPRHPFWDRDFFSNHFASSSSSSSSGSNQNPKHQNNLNNLDYTIGIFGKLLNTHNPTRFVPNGVDEMLINGGGDYLDPAFTHGTRTGGGCDATDATTANVERVVFDNCTESTGMPCYSTAVIGNASLSWIEKQVLETKRGRSGSCGSSLDKGPRPFFALVSVKAPHIQDGNGFPVATPAPWYRDADIPEAEAPRTPNYNATDAPGSSGHHWLVRTQPPLTETEAARVDELYVSRLKTLLSVDDLVEGLVETLERLGVLQDTYVLFTSDNGYRLGQFRMPQCKLHPYENDVRVPMMVRGPGIPSEYGGGSGKTESETERGGTLFSHIHLVPTLLGLATGKHGSQDILPGAMDGTNLASAMLDGGGHRRAERPVRQTSETTAANKTSASSSAVLSPMRQSATSLLIEYTSLGNVVRYDHLIDTYNHSFVALRILPRRPTVAPAPGLAHNATPQGGRAGGAGRSPKRRRAIVKGSTASANLKYIEFRDSRFDWTNRKTPPLERELYDLDSDPYELDNLIGDAPVPLQKALADKTRRLLACSGEACRREHSTGLSMP